MRVAHVFRRPLAADAFHRVRNRRSRRARHPDHERTPADGRPVRAVARQRSGALAAGAGRAPARTPAGAARPARGGGADGGRAAARGARRAADGARPARARARPRRRAPARRLGRSAARDGAPLRAPGRRAARPRRARALAATDQLRAQRVPRLQRPVGAGDAAPRPRPTHAAADHGADDRHVLGQRDPPPPLAALRGAVPAQHPPHRAPARGAPRELGHLVRHRAARPRADGRPGRGDGGGAGVGLRRSGGGAGGTALRPRAAGQRAHPRGHAHLRGGRRRGRRGGPGDLRAGVARAALGARGRGRGRPRRAAQPARGRQPQRAPRRRRRGGRRARSPGAL